MTETDPTTAENIRCYLEMGVGKIIEKSVIWHLITE